MSKLKCDFDSFNTFKTNIINKVENYNALLNNLVTLENDIDHSWLSESQKVFYSKFMERKTDLEQLSKDYSSLISLLNDIASTYENIENSY